MNVRVGFHRLSRGLLFVTWAVWLAFQIADGRPAQFGEGLFYGLLMTVAYLGLCKGIAWVFNGFFPPQR
jgi:hypothetical protein